MPDRVTRRYVRVPRNCKRIIRVNESIKSKLSPHYPVSIAAALAIPKVVAHCVHEWQPAAVALRTSPPREYLDKYLA
jgi:hypothetical protein